ncbi:MAG: hypothetical protein EPN20_05505 [Magnetospirillum sp.]|nr:MAG: hypothetical protein EPN20_05505 [Magnetospirillum sp.]
MNILDEEKAFDIAVRLFEANIKAGQQQNWGDLVDMIADMLPRLYDAVQSAWIHSTMGDTTEH